MLHPTTDLTPAAWLAVDADDFGGTVGELLPAGFETYLRVFHRPDQGLPDDESAASWAEVARRHGTVLHPEAQWVAIAGGRDLSLHRPGDPESPSDQPLTGSLDPLTLRRLAHHLARHTTTPDACHAALWNGTGKAPEGWHDFPMFRRPFRSYWLFPAVPVLEVPPLSVELEVLGMEEQAHSPGGLTGMATFGREPTHTDGTRWAQWSREQGFVQSPSYWWPEDHSWVVHSEVDHDSTVIAGGADLAADLLADAEIECLRVTRRTSLWAIADRINYP
ncbi:hypothetical protein [Nocardioides sp.]|uniref:hypothetical protein n=1 Tax=Nocardioides sp. TaxID=35761 RepID=UPI00271E2C41|nr:hypothetical protein [Nocardioides sp.]MDO9454515.1 hypothetical protein [Nocardioides sp.]